VGRLPQGTTPAWSGLSFTAQPTITATLSALTGRTDQPGEVNGQPITAAHLRVLLGELDALGLRAPEAPR
jgi:hypothetical protein